MNTEQIYSVGVKAGFVISILGIIIWSFCWYKEWQISQKEIEKIKQEITQKQPQ